MFYSELDTELKSSYLKTKKSFLTITSDTLIPALGLNARNLLDKSQLNKLIKIRDKKLKLAEQQDSFKKD